MVYSYPYTLARRAVVAILDLTALNLHLLKTNHWLREEANVHLLHLDGPAWQAPAMPVIAGASREVLLASWTVDEVWSFFALQDAAGIGSVLAKNSVNGQDLCDFESADSLTKELSLTSFAAKKVLRLRDAFLAGALSFF